ncbi:PREDICTED: rho GTPase-activating protein 29-like [Amphimedon queenslandica]|uniref:Rho-GAP domain-containing protein n=1 Tax=Amphimedon queenslandica TaxID=400682 RepID=A0AAN0JB34_AMPQE|nr:PREDICTED: rho GTPase-activating protein 29-like [Amphimedon queenslandica]|eukprot:XP_019853956.1 PREDICTED: rho GTPase-activating protein 29-like [Amphimedon queenslandica]
MRLLVLSLIPLVCLVHQGALSPVHSQVSVGFADDPLATREDVISITKDVQKFLATISQLKKAMEMMDTSSNTSESNIRILLEDKCSSAEPEDEEIDGVEEGEEEYEEKLKEDKPGDAEDPEVIEVEEEDQVGEKLRQLIEIVEVCLTSNQGMQSTELTRASLNLLKTYKSCTHNNETVSDCPVCNEAIDILVDTFTRCVSDFLTGETSDPASGFAGGSKIRPQALGLQLGKSLQLSKSHDNLARFSSSVDLTQANEPIVDTIDQALSTIENSVEVASSYLKFRQKYHREVVGYLSKRAQIEQRYYAQLGKVVRQTQAALSELHQQEECLPLYDVFRTSLDQDNRYAMNCNTTFNLQTGHKVLEYLEGKIQECEKMRKDLMHNWVKERKKLLDAKSSMKSAKAKYIFYGQELARAKNQLAADPYGKQADRRKKEVSDLETKFQDSEQNYKLSIAHCNDCQYQVHATAQKSILCAFRRIIVGFDTTLKAGLESYFQLQYNFFKTLPNPLLESIDETRDYEAGSEFLSFIEKRPHVSEELEDYHFEEFDPESEVWDSGEDPADPTLGSSQTSDGFKGPQRSLSPTEYKPLIAAALPMIRMESPTPKQSRPKSVVNIDMASLENSSSKTNLQRRNSEKGKDYHSITGSPYSSGRSVTDDVVLSKVARTHTFKRLRTPSRCRGCDTYVYFHGFECEICGLSCHRKCSSTLAIRCDTKKLPRKMNTFGVDFLEHLKATKRHIPIIVTKCINEIDERGLNTQGLYRISSAKSKMEKLCQLFEAGSERVDLSDLPPHLISSCLKLYFRQLPEPLLTFSLYQEFLSFAKEATRYLPCDLSAATNDKEMKARELLKRLRELIYRLPEQNQLTLARLMYHLHRVSSPEHVKTNCMPPSNIGIVFGPNLLQQREMIPSLELLANMSYQAKVVEIMAAHVHDIFNVSEEELKLLENESIEDEGNERFVGEEDVPHTQSKAPRHSSSFIHIEVVALSQPNPSSKLLYGNLYSTVDLLLVYELI